MVNLTTCPSNCQYSTFSIDTKYLSCQCEVNNEYIDVDNSEKFIGKIFYVVSDYVLKYTSYKTLKCYKLVFSPKHFVKNAGSIIILILIFITTGFLVYFLLKGLSPLKVAISKLWFSEEDNENKLDKNSDIKLDNKNKSKKKSSDKRLFISIEPNPPKKMISKRNLNNNCVNKEKSDDLEIVDLKKNKPVFNNNITNNKIVIGTQGNTDILKKQEEIKTKTPINNNINNDNNKKNIRIDASGTKSFFLNMNLSTIKKLTTQKNNEAKSVKPSKTKKKETKKKK